MLTKLSILNVAVLSMMLSSCGSEPTSAEYLERAKTFESEGKIRAAAIETRNALKSDGENQAARLSLGLLQLEIGNFAGAEKELLKARELGADRSATDPAIGQALLQLRKFDELRAMDANPLSSKARSSLLASQAFADLANDDRAAAGSKADEALSLNPQLIEAKLVQARLTALSGDLMRAEQQLNNAMVQAPANPNLRELLGDVQREKGNLEQAIVSYGETIKLTNASPATRLKRAQLYLQLENEAEAQKDLKVLSKDGAHIPGTKLALGQIELRNGRFTEAQLRFEEALKEAPEFAAAISSLALTHLALGNAGQAEQYGKQLMAITEGSDNSRRVLAAIRLEAERYSLVEDTLNVVLHNDGRPDPVAIRLMNTALLKSGKLDEAIELMAVLAPELLSRETPESALQNGESPLVMARKPSVSLFGDQLKIKKLETPELEVPFLDKFGIDIARIMELIAEDNFGEAMDMSEALQVAMPDSAVPYNLIGRVHMAAGRAEEAREAFETALKTDANNHSSQRLLAELDLQAGDIDAARNRFQTLSDSGGASVSTLLSLAQLEAQVDDERAMIQWLERAQAEYPEAQAPTLLLARYYASTKDSDRALEELARLDERQRRQSSVLEFEGTLLMSLGQMDKAVEKFDELVTQQPNSPHSYYLRARIYAAQNNHELANQDLNTALRISPNHSPSLLALTNFDLMKNDIPSAETRVALLRELIPGQEELDFIVDRLENTKEQRPDKEVPDQLQIDNTKAAISAAQDLFKAGEFKKATSLLEAWLEANPRDMRVRLTLANTYGSNGQNSDAVQHYETLLKDDGTALPEQARLATLNNLAWYLRDDDSERAVTYARQALEISPNSVATLDTLAMIHFGQGDHADAKKVFDQANEIGFDNPSIKFHGAQIEAALGNDDAARALLAPLVNEGIEFPEAEASARLLDSLR